MIKLRRLEGKIKGVLVIFIILVISLQITNVSAYQSDKFTYSFYKPFGYQYVSNGVVRAYVSASKTTGIMEIKWEQLARTIYAGETYGRIGSTQRMYTYCSSWYMSAEWDINYYMLVTGYGSLNMYVNYAIASTNGSILYSKTVWNIHINPQGAGAETMEDIEHHYITTTMNYPLKPYEEYIFIVEFKVVGRRLVFTTTQVGAYGNYNHNNPATLKIYGIVITNGNAPSPT